MIATRSRCSTPRERRSEAKASASASRSPYDSRRRPSMTAIFDGRCFAWWRSWSATNMFIMALLHGDPFALHASQHHERTRIGVEPAMVLRRDPEVSVRSADFDFFEGVADRIARDR